MQILTSKRWMALFMSLVLILALCAMSSMAQQKTKIAGKMTCAYTKQEVIDAGDTEGHVLSLAEYEGTNVSAGAHEFMDGAQVVNMGLSDLVKGNGTHYGYLEFAKKGDAVFAKWQGKVATVLSAEGTPITAFEGTFSYTKGTGRFENIQGSGSYKGKFISKTIYTTDWEGEYFIEK